MRTQTPDAIADRLVVAAPIGTLHLFLFVPVSRWFFALTAVVNLATDLPVVTLDHAAPHLLQARLIR
jgi:hypothetical protein